MANSKPKNTQKSTTAKYKITIIVGMILAGILILAGVLYFVTVKSSERTYYNILTDLNNSHRAELADATKVSQEAYQLRSSFRNISYGDESKIDENKKALTEIRRIATQTFDTMLSQCESYKENYLHSSEIPDPDNLKLLADDKKQFIRQLRELMSRSEDDSCSEIKAQIGKATLDIDSAEALNNWTQVQATNYSDTAAINSLKKYKDGSYKILYRDEIKSNYVDEVIESNELMIEFLGAFYDYASESDESKYEAKWQIYSDAYDKFSKLSYYDAQLAMDRKDAKDLHQKNLEAYDLIVRANEQAEQDTSFSANIYSSALIVSAVGNYYADYEYVHPEAKDIKELIRILEDKKYLSQNETLVTDGLEYQASAGDKRELTIKDESEGKTYKFLVP